jgi:hypothetical protein
MEGERGEREKGEGQWRRERESTGKGPIKL